MAMHRELTHKEIKLINDLLDGQLPADKAKLAFLQIEQDAALRSAYDKLRWTKSLLRQAPRRKVPHNFTLTRQMAKEATGFYKIRRQTFSIAGAMASFLFVILLAVQLVPLAMNTTLSISMKSEDMAMMEEAPEMAQAFPEEEMLEMPEEEVMAESIEEEAMAMEAPAEEEFAEESAEDADAKVTEETEVESLPTATISAENAVGGGMDEGTEDTTLGEADMADGEGVPEERILEEEEPSDVEMEIAAMDEEMLTDVEEITPREDNPGNETSGDWIFLTTVLAGLLAFVFIFISIRDKNRGSIQ